MILPANSQTSAKVSTRRQGSRHPRFGDQVVRALSGEKAGDQATERCPLPQLRRRHRRRPLWGPKVSMPSSHRSGPTGSRSAVTTATCFSRTRRAPTVRSNSTSGGPSSPAWSSGSAPPISIRSTNSSKSSKTSLSRGFTGVLRDIAWMAAAAFLEGVSKMGAGATARDCATIEAMTDVSKDVSRRVGLSEWSR